jgi:ferredoxin
MAELTDKHSENVPGPFFTDSNCIFCDMCLEIAPSVFKATEDFDHAYVFRQPTNTEEVELAREALERCPVEAIGEIANAAASVPELMNNG